VNSLPINQQEFLKTNDLVGYRVTETQDLIFKKLEDGIRDIHHSLKIQRNLEYKRDDLKQIFNSKTLYPIIHDLIKNTDEENQTGSEYLYDIRRMEIIRMLFEEIKDYLDKSPMFENDLEVTKRLYQISIKLKDTSVSVLKKENIIQEQLTFKFNNEITEKDIKKRQKVEPKISEKQIKKEILEDKLLSLYTDLNLIDVEKSNDSVYGFTNSNKNRIRSLYLDLYIIDTEHDELINNKEPKKLTEENREKQKLILKQIKVIREKQKRIDSMIKNVALTEEKFNEKLEYIEPYFSPLNPINKLQFILENNQSVFE